MTFPGMLKQPSAFLPLLMSLAAMATVGVALSIYGLHGVRQPDEGTAAHLWQLLMAGQFPIVAFFAIKWLPRAPRDAWAILMLQLLAGLLAAAPVFLLGL